MRINYRRLTSFLFLFILILTLSHCGLFEEAPKVKYPNKVTAEMEEDYRKAEKDFQSKRYDAAALEYQTYLNKYPYNRLSDQAQFRLGQLKMLKRQYAEASSLFSNLIQKTPDPAVASRAAVKGGICQYRLKDDILALSFFKKVEGQYVRRHDKIKTGGLALIILDKQGASIEKKAYFYALLLDGYQGLSDATIQKRYGNEAPSRAVVLKQLQTWAKIPATPREIDPRFVKYQPQASAPYVDYKLGMAYYKAGNTKMAKRFLGHLVSKYPSSELGREAKPILAQMGYKPKREKGREGRIRVGVILPLSGKYEQFGRSTLNGMECAAGSKAGCTGLGNVELIIRDDGGSPATAIEAVQYLVGQEKVVAIVGPLSSASALAAAKKAQELGVTMISLAQKQGIPNVGSEIFRFSLTPNQQIRALLTYTTKKKGKKSIGVLYPKNNYGKVFMEKFKSMAPSYGATVTAAHSYTNSKDVQGDVRNLKFSVSKSSPEAPIGFNALFIPDSYMAVLNMLPQLKISGLENILLLGTNAWNDPALAQRSGGNLGDSVFLDVYFKGAKNNRVKTFVREYQTAFGQTPTTLEAMGYDIIRFISEMASKNKIRSHGDFRNALATTSGYNGVTGLRSFASNREARLRPYMLTVVGNQIEEIQ